MYPGTPARLSGLSLVWLQPAASDDGCPDRLCLCLRPRLPDAVDSGCPRPRCTRDVVKSGEDPGGAIEDYPLRAWNCPLAKGTRRRVRLDRLPVPSVAGLGSPLGVCLLQLQPAAAESGTCRDYCGSRLKSGRRAGTSSRIFDSTADLVTLGSESLAREVQ